MKFCTRCTLPDKCDECEEGYVLDNEECVVSTTRSPSDSGGDNSALIGKIRAVPVSPI